MNSSTYSLPGFLVKPTRFLFFTGEGGVGKTSLSAASALTLSDAGQRVLLVSIDAASNLDELLGVRLSNKPVPAPDAPDLSVPVANQAEHRLRWAWASLGGCATFKQGLAGVRLGA